VLVKKTFTKSPVQPWMVSSIRVAAIESLRGRQLRVSKTPLKLTRVSTKFANKTILSALAKLR
jgi:hypothetical protein